MAAQRSKLVYAPLDHTQIQIRVLVIAPESVSDAVICRLELIELNKSFVPYEALSYTWGTGKATRWIKVDGQPFPVTPNLDLALRRLRYPGEERCIWVDAICINQSDIAERNSQVSLMHHVYRLAARVIVWLGPASHDSHLAMDQIERLARQFDDFYSHQPGNRHVSNRGIAPSPIIHLFNRPWWRRAWVLQEVVCSQRVLLICGERTTSWENLVKAGQQLGFAGMEAVDAWTFAVAQLGMIADVWISRAVDTHRVFHKLEATLVYTRNRSATDPRDKIFSILNLVPESEWPGKPDYSKDTAEVYSAVAAHIILKTRRLDLLRVCELPDYPISDRHLRPSFQQGAVLNLPTWVPDGPCQ